jgi:hypothetical protein
VEEIDVEEEEDEHQVHLNSPYLWGRSRYESCLSGRRAPAPLQRRRGRASGARQWQAQGDVPVTRIR